MQKNRFDKFAGIFSRRHKKTIFSDADFLGVLRVKIGFCIIQCGQIVKSVQKKKKKKVNK